MAGLKVNPLTGKLDVVNSEQDIIDAVSGENYQNEAQVDVKVADLIDSAPNALNTLNELADALGDDPNFATTVTNQISTKADASSVSNVDNTSDADKPISTATQTALNLKADQSAISNIDNTADLDKPVSNATQSELDLKADITSISNVNNTSDVNKPVSIIQQAALDLKEDISPKTVAVVNPDADVDVLGWTTSGSVTLSRNTTNPLSGAGDFRLTTGSLLDAAVADVPDDIILSTPYIYQVVTLDGASQESQKLNVSFDLNVLQVHSTYDSVIGVEVYDVTAATSIDVKTINQPALGVSNVSLDFDLSSSVNTSFEIRIRVGSYKLSEQSAVSSDFISSIDNIKASACPLIQLGNAGKIKTQTKFLAANETGNATVFSFSNLVIGKKYKIVLTAFLRVQAGEGSAIISHDGSTIAQFYCDTNSPSSYVSNSSSIEALFTATTTTATIETINLQDSASDVLIGNGGLSGTHATIYEYPDNMFEEVDGF